MSENNCSNNSYNKIDKKRETLEYPNSSGDVLKTLNYECKKCRDPIKISKIYQNKEKTIIYLECDCSCSKIGNMTISDFNNKYEVTNKTSYKNIKIYDNSICNEHKKINFQYYCPDCKKDLCINCIGGIHTNHTVIDFKGDKINNIIDDIIEDNNEYLQDIKNLLNDLINAYENYPCYNTYNNVETVYNFYKEKKEEKKKENNLDNKNMEEDKKKEDNNFQCINIENRITKKKIRFPRELKENSNDEQIISICINKKGFDHFNDMMAKDLSALEILELVENNISNIKPLIKQRFPMLTTLDLEKNRSTKIRLFRLI